MTEANRDVFQIELDKREVINKTDFTALATTLGLVSLPSGGAVVQDTDKATAVVLAKKTGQITMNDAELAAATTVLFTLTNTTIAANDNVVVNRKSGGTAGAYQVWCDSVAAGSCVIAVRNISAGALSEAPVLQFAVIPGKIA